MENLLVQAHRMCSKIVTVSRFGECDLLTQGGFSPRTLTCVCPQEFGWLGDLRERGSPGRMGLRDGTERCRRARVRGQVEWGRRRASCAGMPAWLLWPACLSVCLSSAFIWTALLVWYSWLALFFFQHFVSLLYCSFCWEICWEPDGRFPLYMRIFFFCCFWNSFSLILIILL